MCLEDITAVCEAVHEKLICDANISVENVFFILLVKSCSKFKNIGN